MNKDEIIAAKNKHIKRLQAEIERLKARLAANREYQMIQTFH